EAMIAMAASIAAVYPHMNHIGGDGFWLIREPNGRVRALMGAGPAGSNATIRLYREHSHDTIPSRGPLAALTVPGAMRRARAGYTVTRSQARLTAEKLPEMDVTNNLAGGFREMFLPDGKVPEVGATLKQTKLAETLEHLTQAGLDDFYRGDVGREIAADLGRIGSPVTRADLEKYQAKVAEPLSVTISAGTLYNSPPPTQGLASLMILALFERLRVEKAETFEYVHGIVEATKRAFRVRDRLICDPDRIAAPPGQFLTPAFLG